ncbi:hypothetical protein DICVIV_02063, partial [Dictyocaulus viviparus]
ANKILGQYYDRSIQLFFLIVSVITHVVLHCTKKKTCATVDSRQKGGTTVVRKSLTPIIMDRTQRNFTEKTSRDHTLKEDKTQEMHKTEDEMNIKSALKLETMVTGDKKVKESEDIMNASATKHMKTAVEVDEQHSLEMYKTACSNEEYETAYDGELGKSSQASFNCSFEFCKKVKRISNVSICTEAQASTAVKLTELVIRVLVLQEFIPQLLHSSEDGIQTV